MREVVETTSDEDDATPERAEAQRPRRHQGCNQLGFGKGELSDFSHAHVSLTHN